MTKDEALKMDVTQAIDFLYSIPIEYSLQPIDHDRFENAVDVLSKALEQPAQEPVAWKDEEGIWQYEWESHSENKKPLYTRPAQPCQECENLKHDLDSYMKIAHAYANHKPLSDDEVYKIWLELPQFPSAIDVARAIEKAHGIGE